MTACLTLLAIRPSVRQTMPRWPEKPEPDPAEMADRLADKGDAILTSVYRVVQTNKNPQDRLEMGLALMMERQDYVAHTGSWSDGQVSVLFERGICLTFRVGRPREWRQAI